MLFFVTFKILIDLNDGGNMLYNWGMKALITGGCGFIGSNLAERLIEQNWQIDIVDNL